MNVPPWVARFRRWELALDKGNSRPPANVFTTAHRMENRARATQGPVG